MIILSFKEKELSGAKGSPASQGMVQLFWECTRHDGIYLDFYLFIVFSLNTNRWVESSFDWNSTSEKWFCFSLALAQSSPLACSLCNWSETFRHTVPFCCRDGQAGLSIFPRDLVLCPGTVNTDGLQLKLLFCVAVALGELPVHCVLCSVSGAKAQIKCPALSSSAQPLLWYCRETP